jgi:hypothetical protein
VVVDGLDAGALERAVAMAEPEVVIHQMTGLSGLKSFKRFDAEFAVTNRLRMEGTDDLLEGARGVGVRRFIVQSFGNWNYQRTGTGPKTEQDPFDPDPPAHQRLSLEAIRYQEAAVLGADGMEGIALRYGNFYGPGTGFSLDGGLVALVRKRRLRRLQRRRRRTCAGVGVASRVGQRGRCETAPARPGLGRAPRHRRGRRLDDDPDPGCVQRQSQTGARVGTSLRQLARRLPERPRLHPGARLSSWPSSHADHPSRR